MPLPMAILVRARLLPPFPRSFCALSVSISEMHLIDEQHRERRLQPEPPSPLPKWERRGGADRFRQKPEWPSTAEACLASCMRGSTRKGGARGRAARSGSASAVTQRRKDRTRPRRKEEGRPFDKSCDKRRKSPFPVTLERGKKEKVLQKSAPPPRQTADSG